MKHVDFIVFRLDFGLESGVVFLQFKEFLGLDTTWASLFGQSFDLSTENDDFEGKLVGELPLFLKLLLHSFVVAFVTLDVTYKSHDMILLT